MHVHKMLEVAETRTLRGRGGGDRSEELARDLRHAFLHTGLDGMVVPLSSMVLICLPVLRSFGLCQDPHRCSLAVGGRAG